MASTVRWLRRMATRAIATSSSSCSCSRDAALLRDARGVLTRLASAAALLCVPRLRGHLADQLAGGLAGEELRLHSLALLHQLPELALVAPRLPRQGPESGELLAGESVAARSGQCTRRQWSRRRQRTRLLLLTAAACAGGTDELRISSAGGLCGHSCHRRGFPRTPGLTARRRSPPPSSARWCSYPCEHPPPRCCCGHRLRVLSAEADELGVHPLAELRVTRSQMAS